MFLNVPLCEIISSVIQISVDFNERNEPGRHAIEVKYIYIIDSPFFWRRVFHFNFIMIDVSVNFAISQCFNLNTRYNVLKYQMVQCSFVNIGSVEC
jgi:hypothetical protein